jgi:uncharacterized protein
VIRRLARHAAALVAAAASLLGLSSLFAAGELPPTPTRWVTDGASFLSEPARQTLDARLEAYERQSGHQVLVFIGHTTAGVPIEDFAVRAFKAWGVGRRGQDDGLVLFLFADDHTARFEVGYGLEGSFPDVSAARIIREVLAPKIQAGDHDGAVAAAIDAATSTISGDATAGGVLASPSPSAPERHGRGQPQPLSTAQKVMIGLAVIAFLILLVTNPSLAFFLIQVIASGGGGRGGDGGGGGWSGGGGRSGGGGASGSW